MTLHRARVPRVVSAVLLAWVMACGAGEQPPPVHLTEAVPAGFTREPECKERTICVSKSLLMLDADFLAIRDLALAEVPEDDWEITAIKDVMTGMVLVTAQTRDRGFSWGAGVRLLIEKQQAGWVVVRKQHWVA